MSTHLPFVDKGGSKVLTHSLYQATKDNWQLLKATFEYCFGKGAISKCLWQLTTNIKQEILHEYVCYELKFVDFWGIWVALLDQREVALGFLNKYWFVVGIWPFIKKKGRGRFLLAYDVAIKVDHLKDRKLCL